MTVLTVPHERVLTLLFSELATNAAEQTEVLLGTPGTLAERTNETGTRFWVHRYSDALNRRQETYLGKVDSPEVEHRISAMREMMATANTAIARVRLLSRAGFATVDRKAYFTLASLHNRGLFRAGALLVGSHAYGALLNALGVRATALVAEDVDIARRETLAMPEVLVPSPDDNYPTVPVPELKAHAQGLPHLAYLLGVSQEVPVLSSHGSVLVRVPVPERYAIHKLIVSQDLGQAAVLIEALVELYPGAIEEAASAVPKSAARLVTRAIKALSQHLPITATAAWDTLHAVAAAA